MLERLSGDTRLYFTVGYPIAQVKSPGGITRTFESHGVNAVVVPIEIPTTSIDAFLAVVSQAGNVDGMVVTVPYKFKARELCNTVTERARLLGAANVLRRNPDGSWHGDMTDGIGFCNAVTAAGYAISGTRALLVGAGGAGSAIGLSLLDNGADSLSVFDLDAERRDALIAKLKTGYAAVDAAPSTDPTGYDLIANASPSGMRPGDALPVDVTRLTAAMHVGDVVTAPEIPPLIEAARRAGCSNHTGTQMYQSQIDVIADFLLGRD